MSKSGSQDLISKLYVDVAGGTTILVDSTDQKLWPPQNDDFFAPPKKTLDPFISFDKEHTRVPWDLIPSDHFKGMNFTVNINPDPNCDWYTYDTDKKTFSTHLRQFIQHCTCNGLIEKCTFIYEYGRFGKLHGKLHFHGLVKTKRKKRIITRNIIKI